MRLTIPILSLCFALLGTVARAAEESPAVIEKPVWHVGQTWQVRHELTYESLYGGVKPSGEYVLEYFSVLRIQKIGRSDCFVVRVDTDSRNSVPPHQTVYLYYRVGDLSIVNRVWETDLFLGKKTSPIYQEYDYADLQLGPWWPGPFEMPAFPVVAGKTVVKWQSPPRHASSRELQDPNSSTPKMESIESKAEKVGTGKNSEDPRAVKVTLTQIQKYSKKSDYRRDYEEQIWLPGKPWWSSASDTWQGETYHLVEQDDVSKKSAPKASGGKD